MYKPSELVDKLLEYDEISDQISKLRWGDQGFTTKDQLRDLNIKRNAIFNEAKVRQSIISGVHLEY